MDKKRILDKEEIEECKKLKAIYLSKRGALGLSQELLGEKFDISQGAVGHYLNGRNALNIKMAIAFSKALECEISDFSPRLAVYLKSKGDTNLIDRLIAEASDLTPLEIEELIENAKTKKKFRDAAL